MTFEEFAETDPLLQPADKVIGRSFWHAAVAAARTEDLRCLNLVWTLAPAMDADKVARRAYDAIEARGMLEP
jgi:hypothetical protein